MVGSVVTYAYFLDYKWLGVDVSQQAEPWLPMETTEIWFGFTGVVVNTVTKPLLYQSHLINVLILFPKYLLCNYRNVKTIARIDLYLGYTQIFLELFK